MAEDTFKSIIIGSIVIVLFAFLALSWTFDLASNYDKDTTTLEQNSLDFSALNASLQTSQERGEEWREIFERQNIFSIVAGIVVTGIFKLGVQMFSFVVSLFDLIFIQIFNNVLHIPPIVTGIVFTILTITAIFALWRVLKQGD